MNFFGSSAPSGSQAEGLESTEVKEGATVTGVPEQHHSAFYTFIKQVASFTGDLSQLTCPAFLLSGTSLTEYSSSWCDHPELFVAIDAGETPLERMVRVSRWFTSTLYGSYGFRCEKGTEKKPFNPVLGEQFKCHWDAADDSFGHLSMICEQVSHHPPIGAFYLESLKHRMCVNGSFGQRSTFKGTSVKVEQVGVASLILLKHDREEYSLNYPDINIRGLFTGHIFLELTGKTQIVSPHHVAVFEFIPKPWFTGDYHHFKLNIYDASDKAHSEPLYTATGRWTAKSEIVNNSTKQKQLFFDATTQHMIPPVVPPLEEQSELESRKLWHKVTSAILSQNYSVATKEKTDIEEHQRALRRERKEKNIQWLPALFFDPHQTEGSANGSKDEDIGADHSAHGDHHHNKVVHWTYKKSLHLETSSQATDGPENVASPEPAAPSEH